MVIASIRNIVLGSLIGCLTATISVARAAEPPPPLSAGSPITVEQAPGVDLPAQISGDVGAAIEDVLAGRPQPAVPVHVTLEASGAVIRVGSLWRRIPIAHWDYPSMRTVALNVLDLLQPAPEVPEAAAANSTEAPAARGAAEAGVIDHASPPPQPAGPWSLYGGASGSKGTAGAEPWIVGLTAGAAWTHDWARIGLELGWDHSIVRHLDAGGFLVTVNYDAVPVRLVLAAQNSVVRAGVRVGPAWYRVTGQQPYREVTPAIGPFLAARFPIAGRVRGSFVGGFDYFARPTQLTSWSPDPAYSTPRLAPYLAVVVEADLRP